MTRSGATFADLVLRGSRHYVKRHSWIRVDSGGFGKGQALEDAVTAAGQPGMVAGVRAVSMNFGGQLYWWQPGTGDDRSDHLPESIPATVAVADPRCRERILIEISLRDYGYPQAGDAAFGLSVATTGRVERDGEIVDPATGEPASADPMSITVLAGSPFWADCLSTGLYVLYVRDPSLAFSAAEARRVDMVAMETVSNGVEVTMTVGLKDRVFPLVPNVEAMVTAGRFGRAAIDNGESTLDGDNLRHLVRYT